MSTNQPTVKPFVYVRIPFDETRPVEELHFNGHSEDALRRTLTSFFRQSLLSDDQKTDMARHIAAKAAENANKHTVNPTGTSDDNTGKPAETLAPAGDSSASGGATVADPAKGVGATGIDEAQQHAMIEHYLDDASYEIIPVTMPMRNTNYVGTSLYIDDSGAFKDLPMNYRASKLAQRDIRGDAFLLSNHDDPALDEWGRVDCPLSRYEELSTKPPTVKYDASNQRQMAQTAAMREAETKKISSEDVEKAKTGKDDGNKLFATGDYLAAIQAYSSTVELTSGRRDLLPNEAEVTDLHVSALLNRCLCHTRLRRYTDAIKDARAAVLITPTSPKAYYRLTYASVGALDFHSAWEALKEYTQNGGTEEDAAAMRTAIEHGEAELKKSQKQMFSKMFR